MKSIDFLPAFLAPEQEPLAGAVAPAIENARRIQTAWSARPIRQRLQIVRRTRTLIAREALSLANAANQVRNRPLAEILTAEVLPLADACRFLERESERILKPKRLARRARPLWLSGTVSEIRREPYGLVLIIGPGNYPLFLVAVQALQALVAGNTVLIKPGSGGFQAATAFTRVLRRAGLPKDVLCVLPETVNAAEAAIAGGVDKVIFTGSARSGEEVLKQCARTLTPATVELSGCDAMFVREDADLDLVMRALQFGLRLNNGATCIAPRRLFVHHRLASELEVRLQRAALPASSIVDPHLSRCVIEALLAGADLIRGNIPSRGGAVSLPIVLRSVAPSMRIVREDIFRPILSLIPILDDADALALCSQCPYSLGATVFSRDRKAARSLATRIPAGVVSINDLIVPTADPRLPFGGRGRSGFGTTRGTEGLLEMTTTKVVSARRSKSHRHFDETQPGDTELFIAYIQAAHGRGLRNRLRAVSEIFRSIQKRSK